ncbi:hypothetical protein Ancab_014936, partial [Ancistrocladus abbreviatus]
MLPGDLGISMVLTSTTCAPIFSALVMMTGLALSDGLGLEFYQGPSHNILALIDGLQDEHPLTQVLDTGKNEADGQKFLDQIIYQPEDSCKTKLNSNDTVAKNLRQLE